MMNPSGCRREEAVCAFDRFVVAAERDARLARGDGRSTCPASGRYRDVQDGAASRCRRPRRPGGQSIPSRSARASSATALMPCQCWPGPRAYDSR